VVVEERRRRCSSAILFALPWPLPTYVFVAAVLIVVNERILGVHFFDASDLAAGAAASSLMVAAAWSDWRDRRWSEAHPVAATSASTG
jgi:hypothetical protein